MKLLINNFAKINEADIIIDGITVIAGENNTGKSTVGKVLFSLFNAMSGIDMRIQDERSKEIEQTTKVIIQNHIGIKDVSRTLALKHAFNMARKINLAIGNMMEEYTNVSVTNIQEIVADIVNGWEESFGNILQEKDLLIEEIAKNIYEIVSLPERVIVLEILSRYFNNVFHYQINSLTNSENKEAVLRLQIKDKKETLFFANNTCKDFVDEIGITHKAIYIDNPFIVDELSKLNDLNPMNNLLISLLGGYYKEDVWDGVIESVRAKEKLSEIYSILNNIVNGEIILNQNEEYYLKMEGFDEPVSFENLSTGMKSFVIIKMLLEKGILRMKDVLILDEPEIHLHPQWQIAYAELIVLLQKYFELSVVVTTHSPYFVDAINLFSCKYGTDDTVNYYLSSNVDGIVKMELVSDKIDMIYKKMASPIQMLDSLRYELNNK